MSVNSVCNHNVATIARDADVLAAAVRMREEHVGTLIVVESRGAASAPIGIITDRDIVVGIVARQVSPESVTVGDLMSENLVTVKQDNGIEFALQSMSQAGVRRAPVVGHDGELVGVLSIDDVIEHLAVQLGRIADLIRLAQQLEAVERP